MLHWFDPNFPLNLIYNTLNLLTVIFIIFIVAVRYNVKKNILILLIITTIFPLLLNGPLMVWYELPDQSKYFKDAKMFRNFNFESLDTRISINLPSAILAYTPIPYLENFNAMGLANRLIFSLFIIFLIVKNKINNYVVYYLILSPTMLLYSSTGLKEILVITVTTLVLFALKDRKMILFVLSLYILFLIKTQNAGVIFVMCLVSFFYFKVNAKINILTNILLTTTVGILLFFILEEISFLETLNGKIYTFCEEDPLCDYSETKMIKSYKDLFLILPYRIFTFLLSPTPTSPLQLIWLLDGIVALFFIYKIFLRLFKKDPKEFYFWAFSLLLFLAMYGLTIYNDGTIVRYKLSFIIPFLIVMTYADKNYRIKKK